MEKIEYIYIYTNHFIVYLKLLHINQLDFNDQQQKKSSF